MVSEMCKRDGVTGEYVYYESDPAIAKRILAELEKQR